MLVDDATQVGKGLHFLQGTSMQCDWFGTGGVDLQNFALIFVDVESNLCRYGCHHVCFLLHLLLTVREECNIVGKVQVIELVPQGPLDSVSALPSGCLHNPVYGEEE